MTCPHCGCCGQFSLHILLTNKMHLTVLNEEILHSYKALKQVVEQRQRHIHTSLVALTYCKRTVLAVDSALTAVDLIVWKTCCNFSMKLNSSIHSTSVSRCGKLTDSQ